MATKHLPIFLLNLLEMQLEPQFLPLRALLLQLSFNQMDQVSRGSRGSIWNTGRVCAMLKNFMLNLDFFEKKFLMALIIFFIVFDNYRIEKKGLGDCVSGSKILGTAQCEAACLELEIPIATLKDGNACYKAGNGKCRQDGKHGAGAFLICMSTLSK